MSKENARLIFDSIKGVLVIILILGGVISIFCVNPVVPVNYSKQYSYPVENGKIDLSIDIKDEQVIFLIKKDIDNKITQSLIISSLNSVIERGLIGEDIRNPYLERYKKYMFDERKIIEFCKLGHV